MSAPARTTGPTADGRSVLDQASLERLFGLRREQALQCLARLCRRSPLERRQIQRAGARMGSNQRWAVLQPRTIFSKAVSPRRGSLRARTHWRDRPAATSIINALVRQTRLRATSGLRRSYSPSAIGSLACFLIDPRPGLCRTPSPGFRAHRHAQRASGCEQRTCLV